MNRKKRLKSARGKEYVSRKKVPEVVKYVDGSVGKSKDVM